MAKHYVLTPPPLAGRRQTQRATPPMARRHWPPGMLAGGLAAVVMLFAVWPEPAPPTPAAPTPTPVQQAQRAAQAWPFAAGTPAAEPAPAPAEGTSPWDRLQPPGDDTGDDAPQESDPRQHNAAIAPARLSVQQPLAAQAFLDHVALQPEPRGGYAVQFVLPGSRYERAGLRPGDTIYTLDLPDKPPVDEANMIALTSVQELAFNVVRAGQIVRLSVRLDADDPS